MNSNFLQVPNLTFIHKVIERSATSQYVDYVVENHLYEKSTCQHKDNFTQRWEPQKEFQKTSSWLRTERLYWLAAVFDIIDHLILVEFLLTRFEVNWNALDW